MLNIYALKKAYAEAIILDISDFQLTKGIYWVQGQNGAGKTTFLKILSGIIPYDGKLVLEGVGEEKRERSEYRRKVNYAEAEPQFPDFLTGNDLIQFYEKVKGTNLYYPVLMEKFGLREYSSKTIKTYSSGMLKKLSLVLGFIGQPKLILLDEPLITLDTEALSHFLNLLHRWKENDPELTILFTSHQAPDLQQFPLNGILALLNKTLVSVG